jgi:hypothetical protein
MLVFHEALYFRLKLKASLLCPNQMRDAGIKIEDVPMQFDAAFSHSIKVNNILEIPLEMHGVISHIRTRLPTDEELENYWQGLLQSVAARVQHISAISPCPKPSAQLVSKEEEKEHLNEAKDEDK